MFDSFHFKNKSLQSEMIYVNSVASSIPQVLVPISTAPIECIESKSVGSNPNVIAKKQSKSKQNTTKTTANDSHLALTKLKNATTPNLNTFENKEFKPQCLVSEQSNKLPQKEAPSCKKPQQLKVCFGRLIQFNCSYFICYLCDSFYLKGLCFTAANKQFTEYL